MFVEDDRAVAHMYMIGLEARGFRLVLCDSGATLFGRLASLRPDVIVLDWLLPGVDGAQVFAALRRDERVTGVPVLVLSGLAHPDAERAAALKAGVVAWLEKSHTTPRMLADAIADLLGDSPEGA